MRIIAARNIPKSAPFALCRQWCVRLTVACLTAIALTGCKAEIGETPERIVSGSLHPAEQADGRLRVHLRRLVSHQAEQGVVAQVYSTNGYRPFWVTADGLTAAGQSLIMRLNHADRDGLRRSDYRLLEIAHLLRFSFPPERFSRLSRAAELEVVLSEAFLTFAEHLSRGRIDPKWVHHGWRIEDDIIDRAKLLGSVDHEADINRLLFQSGYSRADVDVLRAALVRYRRIRDLGGWPLVPIGENENLERGAEGDAVLALRRRLAATGDLEGATDDARARFDARLEEAVKIFQSRHGLTVDGRVGEETGRALNVPVEMRIRQLWVNLERLRWLPASLGEDYVLVNIPDFRLELVRGGEPALEMAVIVGTPWRKTPVFADEIEHIVFNPYWNVPSSIAVNELLPKQRENPTFLRKRNYELVDDRGEVVPLHRLSPEELESQRIRLRRRPGPFNDLGQIKFMFPNEYRVYLHDTPSKELFLRSRRTFSHGCIRLAEPLDLVEHVLEEQWDKEKLQETFAGSSSHVVWLEKRLPVYILYLTAWAEPTARMPRVHFRDDVYSHDERLWSDLAKEGSKSLLPDFIALLWSGFPDP